MDTNEKLSQAFMDLIDAYTLLEDELEEKYPDDEDAYAQSLVEGLESSIEAAIEEHGFNTNSFATIISVVTEALEQLDPSAFDEDDEMSSEYEMQDVDYDDDEIDLDEDLDYDEDEDDEN